MNRVVLAACLGWLFSAADIVLLIVFQRAVADGLGVDVQKIRVAIGVGLLGSMLGGILFAQLGDKHGRVRALGWCVVLYSLATAGMALSPNVQVLMLMRFLAGAGTGGEWSLGFALIAEVAPRMKRGVRGGLVAGMFNLGTAVALGLSFSPLSWRTAFGLMALPALGVLWVRLSVPESPVWVEMQARRKRGEIDPALEAALGRAPLAQLFKGRLGGLTIKLTLIFILMNFAFYAFATTFVNYLQESPSTGALGLTKGQQAPYTAVLNFASFGSVLLAGWVSDRVGRRLTFFIVCMTGAAGYLSLHLITRQAITGIPSGLLAGLTLITSGYGINGLIGTISSELFPTHVRATGPGFCQNIGKGIGGAAGPPIAGALVAKLGYPIVMALPGLLIVTLGALIWTLPAVGGRELKAVEDESYLEGKGEAG